MQYRSVIGAIWARQYLLKASKAKLEVSTATKARLAGACPNYRPVLHRSVPWLFTVRRYEARLAKACLTYRDMLHQSVSCIIIVVLHYERLLSASMTPIQVYTTTAPATLFFTAFFLFSAKISTLSKIPKSEGIRKITMKREHTAPLPINFPSCPMAGTEEIKEIT